MILVGIDTGTHTGFAVWDSKAEEVLELKTLKIHEAMERVLHYKSLCQETGQALRVYYEDATQRKWYGQNAEAKRQGAGSVKRDCTIWKDFLTDKGIDFLPVHPRKGATKWSEARFKYETKWQGRTSEHARDACMIVYGR